MLQKTKILLQTLPYWKHLELINHLNKKEVITV
jgi:hypothetical protein